MAIAGYFASALIGLSLGLIGGGGSILTVPVLVYLFGVEPVAATACSLFVVGSTAFFGAVPKWREGFVDARAALLFGAPAIAAVFLTRAFLMPRIPDPVFWGVKKGAFLMGLFAVLMVAAAFSMIFKKPQKAAETIGKRPKPSFPTYFLIFSEGAAVGILTGLVGAGGGFLIIPALVFFARLEMKKAVGTSLVIIAAKSLIGFLGDLGHFELDWSLLGSVTFLAILGSFAGNRLSRKVDSERLKKWFGWFVLAMGVWILAKEFWL